MADMKVQKIKLLKIWEILNWKSDEQHPLSTQDIIVELSKLGIKCDRRTIYGDIDAMQSNGYSILNRRRGHDMVYWVEERKFDLPELKIIMDAIQNSKFIPRDKTEELLNKIASLGGSESMHLLKRNAVRFHVVKHTNDDIYVITECLERAIEQEQRVSFRYFDLNASGERVFRHDNQVYKEEPLAMMCDDGNYYLICYRAEPAYANHVKVFRVDRIADIAVLDDVISKEAKRASKTIANYPKQVFKMYGGKIRKIRLAFDECLIGVMFNKFGEEISIKKYGKRYAASVEVQISPTFWGWLTQFPGTMEIISPIDVKEAYAAWVRSAIESEESK